MGKSDGTLHLISTDLTRDLARELSHAITVSRLSVRVASELGFDREHVHRLAQTCLVHDIGKISLAKYLYGTEDTLTIEEMRLVRMHAELGAEVLRKLNYPPDMVEWVYCHHENCDGSGYPRHLRKDEIPLEARIIRVCDVFSALTADRIYRRAFDPDAAVDMMIQEARFYDLRVFLAFLRVVHSEELPSLLDSRARVDRFEKLLEEDSPLTQRLDGV